MSIVLAVYWFHALSLTFQSLVQDLRLNNLGLVYKSQGKWDEAIECYEQSLQIKRAIGDVHGEGGTLNNLGNVYQARGSGMRRSSAMSKICRSAGRSGMCTGKDNP